MGTLTAPRGNPQTKPTARAIAWCAWAPDIIDKANSEQTSLVAKFQAFRCRGKAIGLTFATQAPKGVLNAGAIIEA